MICQEWCVKSDMSRVQCQRDMSRMIFQLLNVECNMSRVTYQEWHFESGMLRMAFWAWSIESDILRVTFWGWHVKSDIWRVIYRKWHSKWTKTSYFFHPSMPPLFNVLTFLCFSSRAFILSEHMLVHSKLINNNDNSLLLLW